MRTSSSPARRGARGDPRSGSAVIDVGLRDFPPLLFSALRFTLAALPAVFFIGRPRVPWRWVLAVSLTLGVLKFGVLFVGMHLGMPAGLASLVLQGQAVFTLAFAALLLRERPRRNQVTGMVIAASGIVLAGTESGTATVVGFLLAVVAAAFWGLSNVAMRKAKPDDTFRFMVWVSVFPPIPLALVSIPFEGWHQDLDALRDLTPSGVGAILYVAWAATLFGYAVWGRLLRTYDAATVAPFSLSSSPSSACSRPGFCWASASRRRRSVPRYWWSAASRWGCCVRAEAPGPAPLQRTLLSWRTATPPSLGEST